MDRIESLSQTLSQISMYDIKNMYNQAKNVVFNVSEMEAKVRDATNDEPWGASSTLMQEIAQGTFNFQNFNEVMPAIYARFMEKEARQWRQIYKALQLLEYLVKNGSERVVDDARSHIATIKMLRNFYYVDDKGKDQGLNVRNRSKELVELLSDVEKIRTERRKAKTNKSKYTGIGNDSMSYTSGSSRYGGFGSDSVGSGSGSYSGSGNYSGGNYSGSSGNYSGGGGSGSDYGYGGSTSGGFRDDAGRRGFQEYDAGDDEELPRRSNSISSRPSTQRRGSAAQTSTAATPVTPKASEPTPTPVIDLLGMDDDFTSPSPTTYADKALPAVTPQATTFTDALDDDFDDFQTAPTPAAPAAALAPAIPVASMLVQPQQSQMGTVPLFAQHAPLRAMVPPVQTTMSPPVPTMSPAQSARSGMSPMSSVSQMNMNRMSIGSSGFAGTPAYMSPAGAPMQPSIFPSQPSRGNTTSPSATAGTPKPAASANFEDLWSMSLGGSSASKPGTPAIGAKSIKDLEREKSQAGIWGAAARPASGAGAGGFGAFGSTVPTQPSASASNQAGNGLDDLLF